MTACSPSNPCPGDDPNTQHLLSFGNCWTESVHWHRERDGYTTGVERLAGADPFLVKE